MVAFTVDLEPDCPPFLSGFRGVEHGLPALLDLLQRLDLAATFFTTGDVASRYPRAVERVVGEGHELGCHGMTHTAFTSLGLDAARNEIERSAEILRAFAPVTSFRAPYLRFPNEYVGLLERSAFELDSSQARYKLAYYGRAVPTRIRRDAGVGDVVGAPAAARRTTDLPTRAVESDRLVRTSVGIRRSPPREVATRLSIQDRKCRTRVRRRRAGVVCTPGRAIRSKARVGNTAVLKFTWTSARRRGALVFAWVVATVLLVVCARTVDWTRASDVLVTVHLGWIVAAIVANAAILIWWSAFWRVLRPSGEVPVTFWRMFEIASSASALMNTLPFGGGHASSVLLLMRRGETTQRGALSVMALDQLGEGITKLSIFVLVGWLVPLPAWMRAGVTTASFIVLAWFVTLVVASRWAKELEIVTRWRRAFGALFFVLGMKAVEAVAIAAVQYAFGVEISAAGTLLVLLAVILGSMIPVAPGNVGTYEASVFLAYRYLGVSPEQAMSLAIVQHVCFLLPSVGVGYLFISAHTLSRSAIASR